MYHHDLAQLPKLPKRMACENMQPARHLFVQRGVVRHVTMTSPELVHHFPPIGSGELACL